MQKLLIVVGNWKGLGLNISIQKNVDDYDDAGYVAENVGDETFHRTIYISRKNVNKQIKLQDPVII